MEVTALESRNGIVVSGSRDATVKIWDIEKKKGWTFEGKHSNQIN